MATKQSTVNFIVGQIAGAGVVRSRKMFGEYAIYCNDKVVALVCDDCLYVKPVPGARAFAPHAEEAPPYSGSKPFLLIEEDRWEDSAWMTELVKITAAALPAAKPKKKTPKG